MASPSEASLISKLQSSDSPGIHALVSDYLRPLADLKSTKKSNPDPTLIRSLAKRFLSFLNSSLSILPKRIPEISKSNDGVLLLELFRVYRLCLDCLDTVCSQLASKPFSVEFQRLRLMNCLESCALFAEAEVEGLRLLEKLRPVKTKDKLLPEIDKGCGDGKDLCSLVVNIAVSLVRCASAGLAKDVHFRKVLQLVEEVTPWLRELDSNSYEKLHKMLVIHLGKCTLNLLERTPFPDKELVMLFCCTTLTKYVKSPVKDQVFKIAHRICSSLFALRDNNSLYIMGILDCIVRECKVEEGNAGTEFSELVYYCVNKCQTANASFCSTFAAYLNKTAEHFKEAILLHILYSTLIEVAGQVMTPINSIMRLYAAGLLLVSCNLRSRTGDVASSGSAKFGCLLGTLLENKKIVQNSPSLLGSLNICSRSNCMSSRVEDQCIAGIPWTLSGFNIEASMTYLSVYVEALKFLCQPLAKSINSDRKQFVTEVDDALDMTMMSTESKQLIKQIIASKWIETEGLNYIIACLNNIAVVLYRNGQLEKASKVLNLCCKASWLCIKYHCANLSEGALKEFVMEACTRSALLLDINYDVNNLKINKKMVDILKNWFTANDLFDRLPVPIPVVKQWVKIQCKRATQVDEKIDSPSLYCLLSSSIQLSKRNIAMILEQELTAYEEMGFKYSEICQKMQMKITGILLQDIYIAPDSRFQMAQTLVRKGKAIRVRGISGLWDCIQCLSDAIVIMKDISGEMCTDNSPIVHHLCVTYCLRAICTQEADANSELRLSLVSLIDMLRDEAITNLGLYTKQQIFEDVKAALDIWLSNSHLNHLEEGDCSALSDSLMILLYNIIDLLQLKGFMELINDAYRAVIKMFKWKNIPIEKWLTLMWESRSLCHALCVSPVNEEFIINSLDENSCNHGSSFQTDITIDEVQKAALALISNVPVPSHSAFLAGCLFYDLCPRLVANGQLIEALSSAKEAHRLLAKLFQRKFTHNVQQHNEEDNVIVDSSKNVMDAVENIGLNLSVAREIFLFDSISWDLEDSYLSAWKVMQFYLESTLQVGILHEMIGDGAEAETYLKWGKAISCSLKLPLDWDLAKKELQSAEQILQESSTPFCCSKCKLKLEATLYEYLGDLCQSKFSTCDGVMSEETAQNWYTSALEKLDLSEWKNPLSCPEDGSDGTATDIKCPAGKTCACFIMKEAAENVNKSTNVERGTDIGAKQNRNTKNSAKFLAKEPNIVVENKSRMTRSRYRSAQSQDTSIYRKSEVLKTLEGNNVSDSSDISQNGSVLSKIVKCFAHTGQIEETRKFLLRSILVLVSRNAFYPKFLSIPLDYFHHLVAREIPGDVFTIERAEIVHDICWYSLKSYHSKHARNFFCNLSSIKFEDLASWLMVAFVLSRDVPVIFRKVSKLLAVMCVVCSMSEQFSLSSFSKALGENYWSSYFHQASIGTHLTYQFLSHPTGRCKGSYVMGSSSIKECTSDLLRLVPDTTVDLAEYVKKFFAGLPSTTIISISLLGHDYVSLLQELLPYPTRVRAWMLISRLSLKNEPIVVLMPLDSVLQDEGDLSTGSGTFPKSEEHSEKWCCPWGFTVVDDVAPAFKTILEENYLSTISPFEDTAENRMVWWKRRKNLDHRLDNFLRNLEESWFGSWKCLLLGEWLNCKNYDLVLKNLVNNLRSRCKLDVSEGLLRIILGGSKYVCDRKTLVSRLCSKKDCYIAKVGYCDEARKGILLNAANEFGISSDNALELLSEALNVLEVDDSLNREPIILVLDHEVQMLPWENLPILRNQEVYRMPSVSCISAVLHKDGDHKEPIGRNLVSFPLIDPLDAFYLVNPDGDLSGTQTEFENYFRDQNLEVV
ncbi:unnamed protein product [Sphenostylis stenocarpa]|uniref:Separase n=1 Tax=Sphenostylis stenocarpa TaxID=92480 RepID=A0AA86TER7_9FABA|nr:unnamed protein product [Sphenostylis stenocarpa]